MQDQIVQLGPDTTLRLQDCLAESTYGEIWRCTWQQAGCEVVLKRVNQTMMAQYPDFAEQWPASLQREIDFLRTVRAPHLVRLLRHGTVDGLPLLVLEPLAGSLLQAASQETAWPAAQVTRWMRQLINAVEVLHRRGVRHLDLKPGNVLLGHGPLRPIKLADFGTLQGEHAIHHGLCGTLGWQAPEQFFPCGADGEQFVYQSDARSDAFALGLIAYYLLFREKTGFAQWMTAVHQQEGEAGAWARRGEAPACLCAAEIRRVEQHWGQVGAHWLWRVLMQRTLAQGL